jgi:hypothetical protein
MELTNPIRFGICCACSSEAGYSTFDYGAKGDGQTDDLGGILARDAVNAAGGGVLFPRGTFVVSDTIELGASTTVRGLGRARCSRRSLAPSANMLLVRN